MPAVSERLRVFLQQRLTSMDQIQVVLLLRGDRARSWTAPEVATALGSAPEPAAMRLFLLASSGLIQFEAKGVPRYRYVDADPDSEAALAELATLMASNAPAVADIVDADHRDPIRNFADAFKLKR